MLWPWRGLWPFVSKNTAQTLKEMTDRQNIPQQSTGVQLEPEEPEGWGPFIIWAIGIAIFIVVSGVLVYSAIPSWPERGTFGDMFGAVNALFSGLAFAGVIHAINLQRKELQLQRKELNETRVELKRSADAQQESTDLIRRQLKIQEIDRRTKISVHPRMSKKHGVVIKGELYIKKGVANNLKMHSINSDMEFTLTRQGFVRIVKTPSSQPQQLPTVYSFSIRPEQPLEEIKELHFSISYFNDLNESDCYYFKARESQSDSTTYNVEEDLRPTEFFVEKMKRIMQDMDSPAWP